MVRLPERARILPSWTSTAPMGTSPAAAAERASAKASCMYWVFAFMPGERITRGKRGKGINAENRIINAETQRTQSRKKTKGNKHSPADPQPNVEGASVLDKMWWFGKNAISWEGRKRHARVYRDIGKRLREC